VWADGHETKVAYTAPSALADRYQLADDLATKLAGIDAVTDAAIDGRPATSPGGSMIQCKP